MTTFEPSGPQDVVEVRFTRLATALALPSYAHPGDAGADLLARHDVVLAPGARALVPTGLALAIPHGYVGLVHPRSGLAAKHGVTVLNAPGTIDAGYRGEVAVLLLNTDQHTAVTIARGDRIAQLVLQRVAQAQFVQTSDLESTSRGEGGFGSTGGFAPAHEGDPA